MGTRAELKGLLDYDKRVGRGLRKGKEEPKCYHLQFSSKSFLFLENEWCLTLKISVDGGLLETSIGVSSCRFEDWSTQSLRSEDIDFSWSSNIHGLSREVPSVFTVRTFELSAEGKIWNTIPFFVWQTMHNKHIYVFSFMLTLNGALCLML